MSTIVHFYVEFFRIFARNFGDLSIAAPEESFANGLSLDHDHLTGAVRGYLCPGCNTLLGKLRDRMDIFENLKRYLNKELLTQEVTI